MNKNQDQLERTRDLRDFPCNIWKVEVVELCGKEYTVVMVAHVVDEMDTYCLCVPREQLEPGYVPEGVVRLRYSHDDTVNLEKFNALVVTDLVIRTPNGVVVRQNC